MPMDENTKNELIKKIEEQRKTLQKGEPLLNQPRRQTPSDSETAKPSSDANDSAQSENEVDTIKLSDLIPDSQNSSGETASKRKITDRLGLNESDLSWKKAIIIVGILTGAVVIGIIIGFIITDKL